MTIINMAGGKAQKPIVVEAVEDTPSTLPHTYVPREGVDYLSSVTVGKDPNLVPENVKKDVSIFGTVGTLESGGTIDISQDAIQIANNTLPFMTTPVRTGPGTDFGTCSSVQWLGGSGADGYWLGLSAASGWGSVGQSYGYVTLPARANGDVIQCGDYTTMSGWSIMDSLGPGTFECYGYRVCAQTASMDGTAPVSGYNVASPRIPRVGGNLDMIHFQVTVTQDAGVWSGALTVLEDLPETPCYAGSPSAYWAGECYIPCNIHKVRT